MPFKCDLCLYAAARLGGIAAPQIILFRRIHPSLPSIVFGATAMMACGVATLLTETKGVILADDLEEAAKQAEASSNHKFRSLRFQHIEQIDEEESEL